MIIKTGDNMPIKGIVDTDNQTFIVCSKCGKYKNILSVNDDSTVDVKCKCQTPEMENNQ